jgi:hypothetical protein
MTTELIAAICFGTGTTDRMTQKEKPTYPHGTKSLKYTLMRNAMYIGYAFIDVHHSDPEKAAWDIARQHGCNEVWHGSPSEQLPWGFKIGANKTPLTNESPETLYWCNNETRLHPLFSARH